MKLAVIGAGSTYTPELVSKVTALGAIDELALHDIDADRLEVVGALARRPVSSSNTHGWPSAPRAIITASAADAA